ncbi:MAG: hypothetical protein H7293_16765 [Candidatus Saccharibacteria bacterium]|nr:hypothetical protein [Rhodoferax sp.]
MTTVIVCSFSSGIEDMKRKDQRDVVKVLRVLAAAGRYSVFEATANQTIASMMDKICHKGCTLVAANGIKRNYGPLIVRTGGAYPWTEIELTAGGKRLLEDNPA